ncbi:MAG: hypothetical protein AAF789_06905, partial [Bacteroidota bacterium]
TAEQGGVFIARGLWSERSEEFVREAVGRGVAVVVLPVEAWEAKPELRQLLESTGCGVAVVDVVDQALIGYNSQVIIHAMVNNVLGTRNVFGYEFSDSPDVNGIYASRAITPPARRFVFLGIFITLSKNKGINQLPNL